MTYHPAFGGQTSETPIEEGDGDFDRADRKPVDQLGDFCDLRCGFS